MLGQKFAYFLDLSSHGRKFSYRDTQNATMRRTMRRDVILCAALVTSSSRRSALESIHFIFSSNKTFANNKMFVNKRTKFLGNFCRHYNATYGEYKEKNEWNDGQLSCLPACQISKHNDGQKY